MEYQEDDDQRCNEFKLDFYMKKLIQNMDLTSQDDNMDYQSVNGNIEKLNELLDDHLTNGTHLNYTNLSIDNTAEAGNLEVLEWWWNANQNHGIELKYSESAANYASENDHVDILKWLYEKTEFKYSSDSLDYADNLEILNWWLKMGQEHGIKLLYTNIAVDSASNENNIPVLDWWWNLSVIYHHEFRCTTNAIDNIMNKNDVDKIVATLDWWLHHHLEYSAPFLYTCEALDTEELSDPKIIRWWFNLHQAHNKELLYTHDSIDNMYLSDDKQTLQVYKMWQDLYENHGIPIKFTVSAINRCIEHGFYECLEWWIYMYTTHNLPVKFSEDSVTCAVRRNSKMIEWVYQQHQNYGFLFHVDNSTLKIASRFGTTKILDKLRSYGYINECPDGIIDHVNTHHVLQWWWDHCELYQHPFIYTHKAVDHCMNYNEAMRRNWFYDAHKKYGIPFLYTHRSIDRLCEYNKIESLEWWEKRNIEDGIELTYSTNALDNASGFGNVKVLDWWKKMHSKGFELRYTKKAMDSASELDSTQSLDWWLEQHQQSGLELKFSCEKIGEYSQKVQEWWNTSGLI